MNYIWFEIIIKKFEILSLVNSIELIIQKTDFTNQSTDCSNINSTCFVISTKNIGFSLFNNMNYLIWLECKAENKQKIQNEFIFELLP